MYRSFIQILFRSNINMSHHIPPQHSFPIDPNKNQPDTHVIHTDLSNIIINSVAPNFRLFGFSFDKCPNQAFFASCIHLFQIFGCFTFFDCFAFFSECLAFFRLFCLFRTFCFFCLFCLFQKGFLSHYEEFCLRPFFCVLFLFFAISKMYFFMTNEMKNMRLALIQFSYSTQILCTCFCSLQNRMNSFESCKFFSSVRKLRLTQSKSVN